MKTTEETLNANEKRLALVENILALSDEEVLKVIITILDKPDETK